jgi:AraC-like DNA-binding protein
MQGSKIISLTQYQCADNVAEYIRKQIMSGEANKLELGIESLCKQFASSETVLTRAFKQRHQITVHAFIIREKMSLAKWLISKTQNTIKGIAFELGYSELSNFSRDFTKAMGCSPQAWRRRSGYILDLVTG